MAITHKAIVIGHATETGRAAASWCTDGNTTEKTAQRIIKGYDDGDSEIMDMFNTPNLSGEYAGDPTDATIADLCGLDAEDEDDHAELDDLCVLWMDRASVAFWDALIANCKRIAK